MQVIDDWDAAEDSEVEREKAKKAAEAKAKADAEAAANKKSKKQRIEERIKERQAALEDEDDESDVDAWDILLEQAEESEHTPDGTPRPCSQRGSG